MFWLWLYSRRASGLATIVQRETEIVSRKPDAWDATAQTAGRTLNGSASTQDSCECSAEDNSTATHTATLCHSQSQNGMRCLLMESTD